jgi:hypothetical protein
LKDDSNDTKTTMTIIELARCKLLNNIQISDPLLHRNLAKVSQVIQEYNHLPPTLFYPEVQDPSIFYVIGSWQSQEQHSKGFDGSPAQAEILELIKDQMDIEWMHYVDIEQDKIPLNAQVLAINRYVLARSKDKQAFLEAFRARKEYLVSVSEGKTIGGWNLPKQEGDEKVWIQFTGVKSDEEVQFESNKLVFVEGLVAETGLKHARRLNTS